MRIGVWSPGLKTRGSIVPTRGSVLLLGILAWSCGSSVPPPVALDPLHDACGSCRMIVSDAHFAAEIVSSSEPPVFFDDMGCVARYLAGHPSMPAGTVLYVADHRTKAWVPADLAVYTRVDALTAPMGSHVVAHADAASRDQDPDVADGTPLTIAEVFPGGVPGGSR